MSNEKDKNDHLRKGWTPDKNHFLDIPDKSEIFSL